MLNSILAILITVAYPLTPNPNVTSPHNCTKKDKDYKETRYVNVDICKRNVSSNRKGSVYYSYKIPKGERSQYTIDHLVPLSLGGSNNLRNLWPQHKSISSAKYENEIYNKLLKGEISYQEALNKILDFKYKR